MEKIKEFGRKHGFLDVGLRCKAYMAIFEIQSIELDAAKTLMDLCKSRDMGIA